MTGGAPEVATPRMMAGTLAVFYAWGGLAALVAVLGSEPDRARQGTIVALAGTALVCSAVLARWGARWPRWFFHVPVGAATGLISLAALVAPDPLTALVLAAIISFVGADSFFFFALRSGLVQLVAAVGLTTTALLVRGDVPAPTALALDAVVIALGVVTRRLVVQASSASIDGLTGLANRRGFDDALQELTRPGARLSAALLDLDHFKQINDTHGHDAGDEVLRTVARVWRGEIPPGAVLARHGGDEFALLLPGWSGPRALALVRRVRELHPGIGMSCGVAEHVTGETAAQLMRRADRALYAAKAAGRGRAELAGPSREPITG